MFTCTDITCKYYSQSFVGALPSHSAQACGPCVIEVFAVVTHMSAGAGLHQFEVGFGLLLVAVVTGDGMSMSHGQSTFLDD